MFVGLVLLVYFIFQQLLSHLQLSSYQEFGVVYTPGKKVQSSAFPLGHTDCFFSRSRVFAGPFAPTTPM